MSREFGIYPENATPRLWWGARAIITKRVIDIPYDRHNFDGDREAKDFHEFFDWIEVEVVKTLNKKIKTCDTHMIEFDSLDGRYHCEAADKDSGGYLYIGCWSKE